MIFFQKSVLPHLYSSSQDFAHHIAPNVSWTSTMVDLSSMWQLHLESHGFIYNYLVQFQHLQSIFHTYISFHPCSINTICKNRWPKTKNNCNMHFNVFCITFEKFFLKIPNVFSTTNLPLLNVMLPFSMWGHNPIKQGMMLVLELMRRDNILATKPWY